MRLRREHSNFAVAFVGTSALILGSISAVVTLLGTHFTVRITCGYVFLSASLAIVIHHRRLRNAQMPADVLPQIGELPRRKICCPCTLALSREVADLARSCFGSDTIALDRYEQLRVKNPYILACLLGETGGFLGYFDIVPLDDSFGALFINGRLGESDLTHEHVLEPRQMVQSKFIYLSGIAAKNASSMSGMQNASILVWASLKYLEHFYGDSASTAFASAVTREGEHLLQRLGFLLHSKAEARKDRHSLYCIDLSREQIRSRLKKLPDYAGLVELPWNSPQMVPLPFNPGYRGVPVVRTQDEWSATGTESRFRRIK